MCGLFGYAGDRPDDLGELARLAARRGPHGAGVAIRRGDGWDFRRGPTVAALGLDDLDARLVVGHCRLATSGGTSDADAQPIALPAGVIAHNGNVYNDRELVEAFGLAPRTRNDSEVLGLLICSLHGPVALRIATACRLIDRRSPATLAYSDGRRTWLARYGQPLFVRERPGQVAWCSVEFEGGNPMVSGIFEVIG